MNNLRNLDKEVIAFHPDEDGYIGRACPVKECLGYFKVTLGTGVKGPAPCHCPYCGHSGDSSTFFTKEQIEYLHSVVLRKVGDAIRKEFKAIEFEHKPQGTFGIGISLKVEESPPRPIRYYREKKLETEVVCDHCTLRYAIYGVFGWCPDCGVHNSLQILTKNLELAKKELTLAESADVDFANHLVGDALENVVSVFDASAREICSQRAADIRFQSLPAARKKVLETFRFDFADVLGTDEWEQVCRMFQKRHLLAHNMGVVDEEYVQKAKDPYAVVGRKVRIDRDEVMPAIRLIETLGRRLFAGLFGPSP
jgi:hypothetical protein